MDPITIAMGLAQFAPSIIKWITGSDKAADAASKVVGVAQAVTGKGDPAAALAAIQADAQLQAQFRTQLMTYEKEMDAMYLADRQDARARDVELRKAGYANHRADYMVVGVVTGLICCLAALIFFRKDIPGEAVGIISTIAGIFGACLRDAFQFEFGSSRGSKEKDAVIAQQAKGA